MTPTASDDAAFAAIEAEPPELSHSDAIAIAADRYGLDVTADALVSERDQNFRLTAADGRRYVLKIANASEDPVVTDFQISALQHIAARDESIAVPRIVCTQDGDSRFTLEHEGTAHVTRMVTYLPGVPMSTVANSSALCRDLGAFLARLDRALEDFQHPGDRQELLWDMQRAADLFRLLPHVADKSIRQRLEETLTEFESEALPVLTELRGQVIHNDANPANVLVDSSGGRVAGVIDFGDMLRSRRVIELAVAASYLRLLDGDPLDHVAALLAGFSEVTPVDAAETDVLHTLIKTRLATTVLILAWRESLRGADDEYLQDASASERTAWTFLERLSALDAREARRRYRDASR